MQADQTRVASDAVTTERKRRGGRTPDPSRIQDLFLTRLDDLEKRVTRELARPVQATGALQAFALDVVRETWRLSTRAADRIVRPKQMASALALALAAAPTDELGVDGDLARTIQEVARQFARRWLRMDSYVGGTLPRSGGVLVTLNRSAWPLPAEAIVLWAALAERAGGRRDTYVLWEPELLATPLVGQYLQRIGVLAATRDNARLLLERGALVIGFPEGAAARAKTYERRYRLQRFDDGFLVGAAFAAGARIVPAAVVGNEESFPVLGNVRGIPVTPSFPLAGVLGLLPLPVNWRVRLGSAVEYARITDDEMVPGGLDDAVRARMQAMLGELIAQRRSILHG